MATIMENIGKVEKAMNTSKATALGNLLKNIAIEAITKGIKSPEWNRYMTLFADNQEQLDRLTKPDDNDPAWLKESRAYILSNSVCTVFTNTKTSNGVAAPDIDQGLSSNPEAGVVDSRPAEFKAFFQ